MKRHILWLVGLMVLLSLAAVAQTIANPPKEAKNIFDFLISAVQVLGPLAGLYLTYILRKDVKVQAVQFQEMRKEVDGKVTQLIETTNKLSEAKVAIAEKEGMEKGKAAHKEEVKVIKEEVRIETQIIKDEIKAETGQVQPVTIVGQEKTVDVKVDKGKQETK